ncbi:hypothetical protein [Streptomyces antimycoticus]|uniref:hypothetical protein n=1 Tax=Streptomyces antimycoticus TaxID=68175 RepID=UPI0030B86790
MIFDANQSMIVATARDHGFTSDPGHWIFPGTRLTIPRTSCATGTETRRQNKPATSQRPLGLKLLETLGFSQHDAQDLIDRLGGCLTSLGLRKAVNAIVKGKKKRDIIKAGHFLFDPEAHKVLSSQDAAEHEEFRLFLVDVVPGAKCVLFKPTEAGG